MEQVKQLVIGGKYRQIPSAIRCALEGGHRPQQILQAMAEAMETVGERFQSGDIFVPEMLIAAKTMKDGVKVLKPHLPRNQDAPKGKVIIGTVAGDLHDIGKNLVMLMMESFGIEVVDLGIDTPIDKFLDHCAADPEVRIIACSALLTTTMSALEATVKAVNAAPWRERVTVMVGGGPITQNFAEQIGADIYTRDAASAAQRAKEILSQAE